MRLVLALAVLLALLAGAAYAGLQWALARLGPADPTAAPVEVEIPSGATTADVAAILAEAGIIRDPTVFRYYVRYRQLDAQLVSGRYELSAAMSADEILAKLVAGDVVVRRITIPEGLTVAMVADLLDEAGVAEREDFLAAVAAEASLNPYLPPDLDVEQPMEGYLFPATYEYHSDTTAAELVAMMFDRFRAVWTDELLARADELGLSVHEVTTLASIVETEARVAAEQPAIAGVYLNRLAVGMPLQADPTVYYALGLPRAESLRYEDLEFDSPYNTYKYPGLPPGPIAAPGESAIRAVLYPESHEYYYFVAKNDGSGEHYFAATYEEHLENIARAEENLAAQQP
ncbi:MAG: endolytic transglycosylase MltG [Symbiobacterium sp.]|jgi:conserved hypothetical protein TIGR00247|uniref:endolytic transglycosylase MltG n=1 Tax=Symbiobacterium sp. TaxID=1971213 RepID=UPI003463DC5B